MIQLYCLLQAAQIVGTAILSAPSDDFLLQQPGASLTAKVDAKGISGPAVQLGRSSGQLRGRIGRQAADLEFTADRVTGLVGRAPVNLRVTRTDDGIHLRGLYAGRLSNLRIGPSGLSGSLGRCGFTLSAEGNRYEGERSCGGLPVPVVVQIPARLAQRPMGEFAASIVALLGQAN